MQHMLLTEDDVCKANDEFVKEVCRYYGKTLEREEREAIANLGMVYAIRTYQRGVSEFRPYATFCIQEILGVAEENQRKVRRVEHPLSLDMRLKSGKSLTTYVSMIADSKEDSLYTIFYYDFLNRLEKNLQRVANMCIDNYTTAEIAEFMCISVTKVEQLKKVLLDKWTAYEGRK